MKSSSYSVRCWGGKVLLRFLPILTLMILHTSLIGQNCRATANRTYDGSCNNLSISTSDWGAANTVLTREVGAAYDQTDPFNAMVKNRPNARAISNAVFSQATSVENERSLSSFVFTWGQFIDHDFTLVDESDEKLTFPLPSDEPNFTSPISFTRTKKHEGTGEYDARTPGNHITAWIDGSQIYGSDEARANWLRTYHQGKLKMSRGQLLPYNTLTGEADGPIDPTAPGMANPTGGRGPQYVAGDVRAAEQPGLTVLHILFLREHNRICDELVKQGYTNDELNYQTARKQVGALIQSITYNEFLPALGIHTNSYRGYNPSKKPNIMNEFTTAAFRIGHTMVTEELLVLDEDCSPLRDPVKLEESFFNPRWVTELGIEPFIKGLSAQLQQEVDAKIVDGLRNFLFNIPGVPRAIGLDLATLNILRGRDHGLKDYNTIRAYFTGSRVSSFSQINSDPAVWQPLAEAYNYDINNIDPWVGMLAEEHHTRSAVGITMHHILKVQFERMRDGDRFFYLYDRYLNPQIKEEIHQTRLSDIILRNTTVRNISKDVFKVDHPHCHASIAHTNNNTVVACGNITISYGNGSIALTGDHTKNYFFSIYDNRWRGVHSCGLQCGNTTTATGLKDGVYRVLVYNDNWQRACFQEITLTTNDPDYIDADGDGVVAIDDCNDADANLTFIGAACDDGNPNTIEDAVDINCNCAGSPILTNKEVIHCNDIVIAYGGGSISFTGKSDRNFKYRVQKISRHGLIEDCFSDNCGYTHSYDNLEAGTYLVRIWSEKWHRLCHEFITLESDLVATASSRNSPNTDFINQASGQYATELYPNPAYAEVNLILADFIGQEGRIMVYNNLGQTVQYFFVEDITESPITIDVQSLESGIYHVHALMEDGVKVRHKLVVKRP